VRDEPRASEPQPADGTRYSVAIGPVGVLC
jgi:hypothetical protein